MVVPVLADRLGSAAGARVPDARPVGVVAGARGARRSALRSPGGARDVRLPADADPGAAGVRSPVRARAGRQTPARACPGRLRAELDPGRASPAPLHVQRRAQPARPGGGRLLARVRGQEPRRGPADRVHPEDHAGKLLGALQPRLPVLHGRRERATLHPADRRAGLRRGAGGRNRGAAAARAVVRSERAQARRPVRRRRGARQLVGFSGFAVLAGILPAALCFTGVPHALRSIGAWPFQAVVFGFLLVEIREERSASGEGDRGGRGPAQRVLRLRVLRGVPEDQRPLVPRIAQAGLEPERSRQLPGPSCRGDRTGGIPLFPHPRRWTRLPDQRRERRPVPEGHSVRRAGRAARRPDVEAQRAGRYGRRCA